MRGGDTLTESLFLLRKLDDFVPKPHPLRSIRVMANEALAKRDRLFDQMYEADIEGGRPRIMPQGANVEITSGADKGQDAFGGAWMTLVHFLPCSSRMLATVKSFSLAKSVWRHASESLEEPGEIRGLRKAQKIGYLIDIECGVGETALGL